MLSKLSGPLHGGKVELRRGNDVVTVLSDDGTALLVLDQTWPRWVPRREVRRIEEPAGTLGPDEQHALLEHAPFPGLDGAPIEAGDWVSGHRHLRSLGPSGIANVTSFAIQDGSLHVEVQGPHGVARVKLIKVFRVVSGRSLRGSGTELPIHPTDSYLCHVCGATPAHVSATTGIALEHGGPRAQRCPMSGRRLIDAPA